MKKRMSHTNKNQVSVNVQENKKFDAKEYYVGMTWTNGGECTPEEIKEIITYCLSRGYKKSAFRRRILSSKIGVE